MSGLFDVFLSHNSVDKANVIQLGVALKKRGLTVWLDEWELVPGRRWQDALEDIIRSTRTSAVLVGKDGLGPWENPEMQACLNEFTKRRVPVIPVLLPGAPSQPDLPLFLQAFTWVDLRDGFTIAGLDRLIWGITGVKPGFSHDESIPEKPTEHRSIDFVVHVGKSNGIKYPVAVFEENCVTAQETMEFPYDEIVLENHLLKLTNAVLGSASIRRDAESSGTKVVREFGSQLFNALITGGIRDRYDAARRDASRQSIECRILLHIEEAMELAGLPWEYLFDIREDQFPCLSRNTPVVRHLNVSGSRQPFARTSPLRILAMFANPEMDSPIDGEREKGRLLKVVKALGTRVEVEWVQGGTWQALQRKLRQGPWHVFHFSGHGRFDSVNSEGEIVLEDDQQRPYFLSATQLSDLLCDHTPLGLVVLNSCDTATACKNDLFSSTAAKLVRRGIPAVLAMQYEISDHAAITFSQAFYESLTAGLEVHDAVTEARKAVASAKRNSVEWGTPVLFVHSARSIPLHLLDKLAEPKQPELKPLELKPPELKPPELKPPELKPPELKPPESRKREKVQIDKAYWTAPQLPVVVMMACSGSEWRECLIQTRSLMDRPLPVYFTCAHLEAFATNQQFAFQWHAVNTRGLLKETARLFENHRLFLIVSDQLVTAGSDGKNRPSTFAKELRAMFAQRPQHFCGLVGLVDTPPQRTPDIDRVINMRNMSSESLRDEITKVADGLRLKAPPGPARDLPGKKAIQVRVARTREELEECLALRFQVYDRMGYLEDRISQCSSQLELDRYDVFDKKGSVHFIARDHESGEIAGTVRLVLARGVGNIRESVIGSPPLQTLLKQSQLIREIAQGEAEKAANRQEPNGDVLLQKISAPGYFGSLPILQSADFDAKAKDVLKRARDVVELSRLVVGPRYRGLGISKLLVRAVLAAALDLRKDLILLECIPTHISMYESFGFKEIEGMHSRAQELDQEAVAMMLELKTPLQKFFAMAKKDLAMIREGSGPPDPGMMFGSKHLCLCNNTKCWANGAYSDRARPTCPLRDQH